MLQPGLVTTLSAGHGHSGSRGTAEWKTNKGNNKVEATGGATERKQTTSENKMGHAIQMSGNKLYLKIGQVTEYNRVETNYT